VEGVEGKAIVPTTTALCSAPAGDLPNQPTAPVGHPCQGESDVFRCGFFLKF